VFNDVRPAATDLSDFGSPVEILVVEISVVDPNPKVLAGSESEEKVRIRILRIRFQIRL
jgi:hypothetical protein